MIPSSAVSHVGPGPELTALGYLALVLLHLLGFGAVAVLVRWWPRVLGAVRSGS